MSARTTIRSRIVVPLLAIACALAVLFAPSVARAADKKVEAAAKTALKKAVEAYKVGKYDEGIAVLQQALDDCGSSKCSNATKAAVLRDVGALAFKKGDKDIAAGSFAEAFRLDPRIAWDPALEGGDVLLEWEAIKAESQIGSPPGGDFTHTPAAEQAVNTPLPIFVQYGGGASVAKVIVKYQAPGSREFKPLTLTKTGGGWGGMVPCGEVKRGVVRYYVQGFNADGEPVAASGSPKKTFAVPIRWKISGTPPSLPGAKAPRSCDECPNGVCPGESTSGEGPAPAGPKVADGEPCGSDVECESGSCSHGQCAVSKVEKEAQYARYARWWIGVAGSVDFLSMPSANDACRLNNAAQPVSSPAYYCTNPLDGSDYPTRKNTLENASIVPGKGGTVGGGLTARDARVMIAVDYALSASFLVGARAGYVLNTYPGQAAANDGHAFGKPLHFEARATYLIGDEPLAHVGFSPYLFGGGGMAEFDAQQTVLVSQNNVVGQRVMQAWLTAGPWFVAAGGGARYNFSPRAAFSTGVRLTGTFGASGFVPTVAPEVALQYGF